MSGALSHALRTLLVAVETHSDSALIDAAFLRQVALPRARAALANHDAAQRVQAADLERAVIMLWDIYNNDKSGKWAGDILALMEHLDFDAWKDEMDAQQEYQETDG